MRRRRTAALGAAAALLVLTACGGGSDRPVAEPSGADGPTSSPSASGSPSASSPSGPADDAIVSPCALLAKRDYREAIGDYRNTLPNAGLSTVDPSMISCTIRVATYSVLEFGVTVATGRYDAIRAAATGRTTDVPGIGDRAFSVSGLAISQVFAEAEGHTYLVASPLGDVPTRRLLPALRRAVAAGADGISAAPTALPRQCPATTAGVTTALLGDVDYARGGAIYTNVASCGYHSTGGARLQTTYVYVAGSTFSDGYAAAQRGTHVLDPAPGVLKAWSVTTRGGQDRYDFHAYYPQLDVILVVRLDARRGTVDDQAFVRFAQAWLTAGAPRAP